MVDLKNLASGAVWQIPLTALGLLKEKQIQFFQKDLQIYNVGQLLKHFPFRYEDRTQISKIRDLHLGVVQAQIKGKFEKLETIGQGKTLRLVGRFSDGSGSVEVVWFQKIEIIRKIIQSDKTYLLYGRLNPYQGKINFTHPELELFKPDAIRPAFEPVYASSETLKKMGFDSKGISKLIDTVWLRFGGEIAEPFSADVVQNLNLISLPQAFRQIHKPTDAQNLEKARQRLKIDELFPLQFLLLRKKKLNQESGAGYYFPKLERFNRFYSDDLPFPLTGAQKRVLKEIRSSMLSGKQMNRLLQGDVGSGKTIVSFLAMLMAADNGFQSCLMAPTEILAQQHYNSLRPLAEKAGIELALLTGSSKTSERKTIGERLLNGQLSILVGTHAVLEEHVKFQRLGLSVIDEQHRFGVAQRGKLHQKNENDLPPHILVMSATPIPRTLAMAFYSDLDVSILDEMPPGRKEIRTVHRTESKRLAVFGFIKDQLIQGRQAYFVYPMIEESEKLDLTNLMEGYESISRAFPKFPLSIVHGKMKPADKDYEMKRFAQGETKIMVATTVIEVGVNVPNASIMVVENAERFGLTQLHQLRGRVGRGEFQSYCILMTGQKVSREGKERIETLVQSVDGFEIAEKDLKMRGPGDLFGTQQSGLVDLKLTNLAEDEQLVRQAKLLAEKIVDEDPNLESPKNQTLKQHIQQSSSHHEFWSSIS